MKNEETYYTLFDLALSGENKGCDFFNALSATCDGYPEIAAFWKKMAADESDHISLLEELRASLTAEQLSLPTDPSMLWKARKVQQFSVKDTLEKIKTLDDAYERAHELESSEINTVYTFIMEALVSAEQRRSFLKAEIKNHQNKLVLFSETFGDARWRKNIVLKNSQKQLRGFVLIIIGLLCGGIATSEYLMKP